MSKSKIIALAGTLVLGLNNVAFALDRVAHDPAHTGPGWLASFAAVCGTVLAFFSIVAIYMMVSGKAGKYSE
ncbi:MAG: hypothetical protein HZA24_10715 [Nitrospirae bacterium]|nr:hypothetical protein [Nitrospirota bacterium]